MIGRLGLACLFAISFAMTAEAKPIFKAVPFAQIEDWSADDHDAALAAFQKSCEEILASGHGFEREVRFGGQHADWLKTCKDALHAKSARQFFEEEFIALRVTDPVRPEGLFTGYYEPEAEGSGRLAMAMTFPSIENPMIS